jgi:translation elongation factor P/translation initiation factor 5A
MSLIKFTRHDSRVRTGTPVWINPQDVVAVESRSSCSGGSFTAIQIRGIEDGLHVQEDASYVSEQINEATADKAKVSP